MLNQPRMINISHMRKHSGERRRRLIKRKRSSNVIHVSLYSSLPNRSINTKSVTSKNNSSIFSLSYPSKTSIITQSSIEKPPTMTNLSIRESSEEYEDLNRYLTDKQKYITNNQILHCKKDWNSHINQTSPTQDHHEKKKRRRKSKKCLYICLCIYVLVTLLCIPIPIVLPIVLSNKQTATVRPSTVVSLRWNTSGITLLGKAGVAGANSSLLYWPYGLAFDSSNTLYISDYGNHRIQKLSRTEPLHSITVAGATNGLAGNTADRFNRPVSMLFDADDNMYITDRINKRVQFWPKGAAMGTTVAGINGTLNISFGGPSAIIFGPDSQTMFITDTYSHQVISYPSGIIVAGGNGPGNNAINLYNPYGLVYESISNSLIIPNHDTNNIVRWEVGAFNRTHLVGDIMGTSGSSSTLLKQPVGITMDPMGNIYVADAFNHRIQLFLAGQTNATTIAGTTSVIGSNPNQLYYPFWVILDNQLNLYVSDTYNNRVQKFLRY